MYRFLLRNTIRDRALDARRALHPGQVTQRPYIGGRPLPPNGSRILQYSELTPALLDDIEKHQVVGNVQLLWIGRTGNVVDIPALRKERGWTPTLSPEPAPEGKVPAELPPAVDAETPGPVSAPEPAVPPATAPAPASPPSPSSGGPTEGGASPSPIPVAIHRPSGASEHGEFNPMTGGMAPVLPPDVAPADVDAILEGAGEAAAEIGREAPSPPETSAIVAPAETKPVERRMEKKVHSKDELDAMKNEELRSILVSLGGAATGKPKSVLVSSILERQPSGGS